MDGHEACSQEMHTTVCKAGMARDAAAGRLTPEARADIQGNIVPHLPPMTARYLQEYEAALVAAEQARDQARADAAQAWRDAQRHGAMRAGAEARATRLGALEAAARTVLAIVTPNGRTGVGGMGAWRDLQEAVAALGDGAGAHWTDDRDPAEMDG